MATRELGDVLSSGELSSIKLAGTADANALMQKAEIDARLASGDVTDFKKGGATAEEQLQTKAEVDALITAAALGGVSQYSYNYVKNNSIIDPTLVDIPETFVEVAQLATPVLDAGTYEVGFSLTTQMDTTTYSVILNWWDNGSMNEYTKENADKTDVHPMYYMYPKEWAGGVMTFSMNMRKENAAGPQLDCLFIDIMCKRVSV